MLDAEHHEDKLLTKRASNVKSSSNGNGDTVAPLPAPTKQISQEKKYHILIIEDNVTNAKILSRSLTRLGHNVHVCGHGKDALDYIATTQAWASNATATAPNSIPLDLVLSDMEMPVMDGMQFVREARRLQGQGLIRGHLPVVAITGNAREEQVRLAVEAGMVNAFVSWLSCGGS